MRPFKADLGHLDTIPGVGQWTAEVIAAEIGTDMSRFPSAGHLLSWADYFDHRQSTRLRTRLVHRLQGLGYDASLTPKTQAA